MENYEDYLKQVADLGGANEKKAEPTGSNNKKKLHDLYNINISLIRFFYAINSQFELWIQNQNLDDYAITHILNSLNQHKAELASLKFEVSQTDISDFEGNTRSKLEKQLAYIKNEMVLEEAHFALSNLKQIKNTPKTEPKPEIPKNDSNFLRTFLKTEYGEGHTYEGDLLNNLPNGNGALYYPNKQLYAIGIWANGRLQNQTKVYHNDGKLWKEGHFLNGKLEGNGKEYYYGFYEGKTKAWEAFEEGIFFNGKLEGNGKFYRNNKLIYDGNFLNGEYNGYGNLYTDIYSGSEKPELFYKGEFKEGKAFGRGIKYFFGSKFKNLINEEGYFENWQLLRGKIYPYDCKLYGTNNVWFEGIFSYIKEKNPYDENSYVDRWHSASCIKKSNTDGIEFIISKGSFKNGELHGKGENYDSNGLVREKGIFIKDLLNGEGEKYYNGKISEKGFFKNHKLDGPNCELYLDGILYESGSFKNGKLEGSGIRHWTNYSKDSNKEVGFFINGTLNGQGKRYGWHNEEIEEEGIFKDGVFQGK